METNGVKSNRNRHSPSSDRFIGIFTRSNFPTSDITGDDLSETEVFWTDRTSSRTGSVNVGFRQPKSSGILAALNDGERRRVLLQKDRVPSAMPKPNPHGLQIERELSHSQSLPCRRFQNSAPVDIPSFSKAVMKKNRTFTGYGDRKEEDNDEDDQLLPPHEIVDMKVKETSSVLEGVGRTLKGRDLRQVRNAVWSQTGFLD